MKKSLFTLILLMCSIISSAALKELTYYYESNTLLWATKMNYVPCKEPFNIKLLNCPIGASIVINIYDSTGKNTKKDLLGEGALFGQFTAVLKTGSTTEHNALINQVLDSRRFYFIEVVATPAAGVAVTQSKIQVYAIAPKDEISTMQFLGSIGDAMFFNKNKSNTYSNFALVTGVKFKLKPVSLNSEISRFGLYPRASRLAFVVGAVLNDLNYKSSTISSSAIGLKPMLGVDFEFNKTIGITAGTVIGRQEKLPALNDNKRLVFGFFLGLSFSADVFQAFKSSLPATANLPAITNK